MGINPNAAHPRAIKHPASFSDHFLPIFAALLRGTTNVLDPMAGTGKLAGIKEYGYGGRVVCNELESEWVSGYAVDEWHFGDAAAMSWAADKSFDAICTSPSYGNRMGDRTLTWEQNSRRVTYDRALGREPSAGSTLYLQWNKRSGDAYQVAHIKIWRESVRVVRPGGLFVLNVSNHVRNGKQQDVVRWHRDTLQALGLILNMDLAIPTRRMGFGANRHARVEAERILVFRYGVEENGAVFSLRNCRILGSESEIINSGRDVINDKKVTCLIAGRGLCSIRDLRQTKLPLHARRQTRRILVSDVARERSTTQRVRQAVRAGDGPPSLCRLPE